MLATVVFITINNIGGKNFGEFGELKHFIKFSHQFFTISITFPMQMDFNLPNFLCKPPTVKRRYSPNFFTTKVLTIRYIAITYVMKTNHIRLAM